MCSKRSARLYMFAAGSVCWVSIMVVDLRKEPATSGISVELARMAIWRGVRAGTCSVGGKSAAGLESASAVSTQRGGFYSVQMQGAFKYVWRCGNGWTLVGP